MTTVSDLSVDGSPRVQGNDAPAAGGDRAASKVGFLADPLAWATAIVVVTAGLWATTDGLRELASGGSSAVLSISRAAGLAASLAALFGLVLTSRPRWLERTTGLDRMLGWHRWTGMTAAFGMLVHVLAALVATAGGLTGLWSALVDLLGTDWYVAATVAALLFALVSVTSWRRIRAHLAYETWHGLHVAGYLAIVMALPHQLFSGSSFAGSRVAQLWWLGLFLATLAVVLSSRVGALVRSVLRPRTHIARVVSEAPGVASLVITGPGVERLRARPGQFVFLRVLTADLWWQAHPYSLSAASQPGAMRLTVKALGDASRQTLAVRPGTRVLLEGPYGVMSIERAAGRPVLLIGAGVGLAPMRALLEASSASQQPVVLARAHSPAELPLATELEQLARARSGVLVPVTGPRSQFPSGNPFTAEALAANVPDLTRRSVFVCGPAALQDRVRAELARAGVPREHIHVERFAW